MSKLRISESQNYHWSWWSHIVLDPFIGMVALGAVGHMRHWPLLYSFSYLEVFLLNLAAQHLLPILVTSDLKKIPSTEKK